MGSLGSISISLDFSTLHYYTVYMTTMIAELYDALKEAGASEEKAKAAASAIADHENHFTRIESDLKSLRTELDSGFKSLKTELDSELKIVKAELNIIKWLIGFLMAGIISLIIKAFI